MLHDHAPGQESLVSVRSYPLTSRAQGRLHGCPSRPHNNTHLVAVFAPSAKDWGATLAERASIPSDGDGMLVGVLIDHGLRSALWTYKGNSPQLKNNYMAKLTVPTGRPRCGCNTAYDMRRQQSVCIAGRACVCMRDTVSVCINMLHPAACLMQ